MSGLWPHQRMNSREGKADDDGAQACLSICSCFFDGSSSIFLSVGGILAKNTDAPSEDGYLAKVAPAMGGQTFQESYQPFSGTYLLNMTDIYLPGKGGLDLVIQRYYRPQIWNRTETNADLSGVEDFVYHSAGIDTGDRLGGNGWQLHMGKVRNPCGWGSGAVPIGADNPVVVMPDGTSERLDFLLHPADLGSGRHVQGHCGAICSLLRRPRLARPELGAGC